MIPTLKTYTDWLNKAKFERDSFRKNYSIYDLANCLLTLNAIPEWIFNSKSSPKDLTGLAKDKHDLVSSDKFVLDISKLSEIDHQLKLVRMFCNHAKHNKTDKKKNELNFVSIDQGVVFPINFPGRFDRLSIGDESFLIDPVLESVIAFWELEFEKAA